MKRLTLFLFAFTLLFLYPSGLFAQNNSWSSNTKKEISKMKKGVQNSKTKLNQFKSINNEANQFNHAVWLAPRLTTDGWSGKLYYGWSKKENQGIHLSLGISEIKQEKEVKQKNHLQGIPNLPESKSYIYGKINNVYLADFGIGREQVLLNNLIQGFTRLNLNYTLGLSVALLKPYYLDVINYTQIQPLQYTVISERYEPANSNHFLDPDFILGASGWSKGLGNIKPIPGLFGDLSISLTTPQNKRFLQGVSTGLHAALYAGKLPVMAEQKAHFYECNLFVSIAFGGRWH